MYLSLFLAAGAEEPLLLEAARRADCCGLAALWLHGTNPAVLAAAVAVATRRLDVRAGGLALPLHNPIRVAEEWSLVDNLSHGRAGLAFTSADGSEGEIETVRRLWRGEAARVPDGEGRLIEIRILPQPVQKELPFWLTEARAAADRGAHLLLAAPDGDQIAAYRAAGGDARVTAVVPGFPSVEDGLRQADRLQALGVDEIACRARLAGALDAVEILEEILRRMEIRHGG